MTISEFVRTAPDDRPVGGRGARHRYREHLRAEAAQRQARFDTEVEAVAVRRRVHRDEARWLLNQRWRGVL